MTDPTAATRPAALRLGGTLDLSQPRRVHVANVGGAGMSAVATLLAESGHRVSGHDPAADTPFLPMLRSLGVEVTAGGGAGVGPALPTTPRPWSCPRPRPTTTPTVVAARERGVPVLHRAAALAALCARAHARWRWRAPTARRRRPPC